MRDAAMPRSLPAPPNHKPSAGVPDGNLDAERSLLGAICEDNAIYAQAAVILSAEDFSDDKHKLIYLRMGDIFTRGEHIDRVTLANELLNNTELNTVGGREYLVTLDSDGLVITEKTADSYIGIIRDKSMLRRLALLGQTLSASATSGASPQEVIEIAAKEIYTSLRRVEVNPTVSIDQYSSDFVKQHGIKKLLNPSLADKGLLTGFDRFDDLTDGFHESEIFMLAADSGNGKTTWALQVVRHITRPMDKSGVLILSMEMRKRAIYNRLICGRAGVSVKAFRKGELDDYQKKQIFEASGYMPSLPIYMDDNTGLNVVQLRMKVESMLRQQKLKLVVLDYIQLGSSEDPRSGENERLSELGVGIQRIAKSTGVPWLILSQINKGHLLQGKGAVPGMHSLRGSGTLSNIPDVIGIIHRTDAKQAETSGLVDLVLAKVREGETGTIPNRFLGWKGAFEERASERRLIESY